MAAIKKFPAPDIFYHPNIDNFRARSSALWTSSKPSQGLPPGFPKELKSSLVWDKSTFKDERDWIYLLDEKENTEIHEALAYFKGC